MERIFIASKILIVAIFSLIFTGCGSSSGQIDDLFGSSSAPVLTSIPNQTVAQTTEVIVDINNIQVGLPGNDTGMSYACYYDQTIDDNVDETLPCTSLPNSAISFDTATGILKWTPSTSVIGNYEFKIRGTSSDGTYDEVFTIGSRLLFAGLDAFTNITGLGVTLNWSPNTAATGYQIYKLNTITGQYELLGSIIGGSTSTYNLTGLVPNSPYTLRLKAVDALGYPDGNVVSRSFTTNSLTKFSMIPATATVASGSSQTITAQAYNSNDTPQVVGGLSVTPQIQSGTSTGTFTPVIDNNDGTYTFTFTPVIVGTPVSLEVTSNTTFYLNNTSDITVITGSPSNSLSNINISSSTVVSANSVTVTATIKDSNNNPIVSGSTITFNKAGGTSTGSFSAVTNQGNGVYTTTYTGITSGTAQTISVSVDGTPLTPSTTVQVLPGAPSNAHSTLTISAASISSGASATVTATLKDVNNNPVPSGILVAFNKAGGTSSGSFSAVVNAGNGAYTTTYTGLISGTAQVLSVAADGVTLAPTVTITVVPGAAYLANSNLTVSNPTVISDQFVTLTATLKDSNNNPIDSGITVTFGKTGGTSTGTFGTVTNQGNGVYNIRYTGVVAGTAQTLTVLVNGVDLGASTSVNVVPGAPSSTQSAISVTSGTVVSGATVTATATIRDTNNNPISSGILVTFSKAGGTSTGIFSSVTNQGNGQYAINYEGVASGSAQTIGVIVDGSNLGPTTTITVTPGAPANLLSTFTVSAATVISGSDITLTATIKDANNNPISAGIVVGFDKVGGTSFGNLSAVTNQGNGVYTATYTGITAGTANTLQTTVNGSGFATTQTVQVLVGAPNLANSSLTVAPATLASGAIANISAVIRDVNNNPITSEYAILFDTIGGSSTGTLGTMNNAGNGNFTNTYTGATAGSAQTLRVLADGAPIAGLTRTIQVVPGSVDPTNSTFTISSSTVQSGSTVNLTMNLRDANNNAITSGLTVTFNKTAGVSNGTISGVSNLGSGNYSATYTGTTQGSAQTITLVTNGTAISAMTVSATVTEGPPNQMSIVGPANPLNSIDCNGPYVVTLQDAAGNTTSSLSSFNMSFSSSGSVHTGTLFTDASCTSTLVTLPFGISVTSNSFYYKSYLPQSMSLTLTPSLGTIASQSTTLTNVPVISWIGSAGEFTMSGSGNEMVADDTNGLYNPQDVVADGNYIYAVEATYNRIVKYDVVLNEVVGWIGHVGSTEGISAYDSSASCNNLNPTLGDLTPVWCKGGRSNTVTAALVTGLKYITVDSTYIYVTAGSHRILRFNKDTGAYGGWIGRILASPATGPCASSNGLAAPGWCVGGTSQTGTLDGMLNNPQSIVHYGGYLYVMDYANQRLQRFVASTGAAAGWVGLTNAAPQNWAGQLATCSPIPATNDSTPGWCLSGTTGTAKASDRYNLSTNPVEVAAPNEGFKNAIGLTTDGTYLYVGDSGNVRVVRIDLTSGAFSGYIGSALTRTLPTNIPSPATLASTYTSNWTTNGITYPRDTTNGFGTIRGLTTDGTYLYITDDYHRLMRVQLSDGQNFRWIGRVSVSPTGGYIGCSSTPVSGVTPGWCIGGQASRVGNTNSAFYSPYGMTISGSKIYVADYNNFRIQSFDLADGTAAGWIGTATSQSTKWSRTIASGVLASRAGIDDYANLETSTAYNSVSMNSTHMFETDFASARIKKFNRLTGQMLGYIGIIGTFAPTGPAGCVGFTSGMTPDWCTGGGRTSAGSGIHGYNNPYSVTADSTYIYIANYSNHRVDRVRISDALYQGWIGKINTVPTDGGASCTGANVNDPAPTWCIGGSAINGTTNGMFNAPRVVHYDSPYLYVTDNTARLMRVNPTTGAFDGAIGHITSGSVCTITSNVAQGWCTTAATGGGGSSGYGSINSASGIAANSSYIFVSDTGTHRISRYNKTSGAPAGIIGRIGVLTNLSLTGYCVGQTANKPLQGWCNSGTAGQNLTTGAGSEDGSFNIPRAIWANNTYLYVADSYNHRIVRISATDGSFQGWKGYISGLGSGPTAIAPAACNTAGIGNITPTWCTGGSSGPAKQLGGFDNPVGLYGDTNYLYIKDGRNNRTVTIPIN
ncbi:MAG: invasin domain 3-containing protein [Bdellovibrionota bacterium]